MGVTFSDVDVDADGDNVAIGALTGTGMLARTANEVWALRPLTGTANKVTVTDGDGVNGPPTFTIPDDVTLVTPALGTPSAGNLAACAGYTFSNIASKPTTLAGYGITDAQGLNANLTTWTAVGRATGFDTFVATPTSANLRALVSDETGSGALVFANSPTLVTPALGTPASGALSNCTGYPYANLSGAPTLGTAAAKNTGTSGDAVPLLNASNAWSATQILTNNNPLRLRETGGSDRSAFYMGPDNVMYLGGPNNALAIDANALFAGTVYSNTTANAVNVNVDSTGIIRRSTSAAKYKTDIEDLDDAIASEMFDDLNDALIWYRSNTEVCDQDNPAHSHYGVLADRMASKWPQLCAFNAAGEVEGFAYERSYVCVVRELAKTKCDLQSVKAEMVAMADRIAALEAS